MRSIAEMLDKQIEAELTNYAAHLSQGEKLTDAQSDRYLDLLKANGERGGLRFDVSMQTIEKAAQKGRFLSYGELAEANGLDWNKARRLMPGHLWELVSYADAKGWPMVSAIVVNKTKVETGEMDEATIKGFVRAAEKLGHRVDDPQTFLKDQQNKVFSTFMSK
jgi:hypothetical protein